MRHYCRGIEIVVQHRGGSVGFQFADNAAQSRSHRGKVRVETGRDNNAPAIEAVAQQKCPMKIAPSRTHYCVPGITCAYSAEFYKNNIRGGRD